MSEEITSAYRSPLGRVMTFVFVGGKLVDHMPPGPESDRRWAEILKHPPKICRDDAAWMDEPDWAGKQEKTMQEENKNTETETMHTDNKKSRKKRERPGTWTPTTLRVPIPGTDNTTEIEMWHVEYDGQAIDVQKTRDGSRTVTDWVRRIQKNKSACLALDRITRTVKEIIDDQSLSEDVRARARDVYAVLRSPIVP